MWEIIFEQGKNWKNRNLKFLEVMVVGAIKGCVEVGASSGKVAEFRVAATQPSKSNLTSIPMKVINTTTNQLNLSQLSFSII